MAERGEYLLTQSGLQVQTLLDKVQNPATQPEATERLITAGGVQAGLAPKYEKPSGGIPASDLNGNVVSGIVFDVSVNNGGATFASLSALLSSESLSTLIPAEVRKGGMQLRFINSETEQYEQYRLMSAAWSANPTDWQGIDDTPTAGSDNLVKSGGVAGYVSVSQNSQTGKTELKIGDTPALIVDNEPEAGSDNLVKSGGVQNELALGAVYDVTAKNSTAGPNNDGKWASLSALLSDANLSTLIPTAVRKGGMSIKFVCSSDNKYVQYRLMSDEWSTTESDWQGVDEGLTAGSKNLAESGAVISEFETYVGIPREVSLDFTIGTTTRNINYKVGKGWKLSGNLTNKSISSSDVYVKAYNANGSQIGSTILLSGVVENEARSFYFYSETDDIEYITITITTRIILDVVVSAEKSEYLRNELHSTAADIYKDMDRRTVTFVPKGSGLYNLAYDNLVIKSGASFKLTINGSTDWTRLIISTDKNGTNRIYDVINTTSSFERVLIANANIDKLYIYVTYTGTITLSSEIITNFAYSLSSAVAQQQTAIVQLIPAVSKNTSDIADIYDDLYKVLDEVSWDSNSDLVKNIMQSTPIGKKVRITVSNIGNINDTAITLLAKGVTPGVSDTVLDHVVVNKGGTYTVDYTPLTFDVIIYQIQCNSGRTTCTILFEESTTTRLEELNEKVSAIEADIIPSDYSENKTIDKNGVLHSLQNNYKVTPYLRLDGNDIVLEYAAYVNSDNVNIAIPCVFYDRNKNKLYFDSYYEPENEGYQNITIPTASIPEMAAYIRCTLGKANGKVVSGVCNNIEDLQDIANDGFSLGNCRDYVTKNIAYHPLGEFTKAYICFTDDDGTDPAISYTLPMFQQKDVAISFMIASNSRIMLNPEWQQTFVNAVNAQNSKIFVGQHGLFNWTVLSESELYNFFMQEKEYFDALGIEVKGAAVPSHYTSYLIEAMAGGLYDAVRTSWVTYDGQGNQNHHSLYEWRPPICSPRSNMYCLPSANIRDYSLAAWKENIDYAVAHNRLINIYFHDFDFVEDYGTHHATAEEVAARKALLEGVIDYAKSVNIEFVSLGQVARLT